MGSALGLGIDLHQSKQSFSGGDIRQIALSVCGWQFQSVTICHRLAAFFSKPVL
jgi:hypothetical protein